MADKRQAPKTKEPEKKVARSRSTAKSAASRRPSAKAGKESTTDRRKNSTKTTKKAIKKTVAPSPKSTRERKKSSPKKVEQNRPQGSPEGKRKRQQAKRKRRFDSAMTDFKERTNIESLEPLTRVPATIIGSGWHQSKITSMLLLFLAVGTLFLIFTEPRFFVYADDVAFQNLNYLYPEELYPELEIDGWSIFWIRPEQVRQAVVEHSYVSDAAVSIRFPAQITIAVEEEEPAALWVTDEGQHWVLADGTALPVRTSARSNLVQILDGKQHAALADAEQSFLANPAIQNTLLAESSSLEPMVIDAENLPAASEAESRRSFDKAILASALDLVERYPGLNQITYNRGFGLNFMLPERAEWIYWGDGNNFAQKLENMAAIHHAIAKNEVSASVIDLRSPEKPYYR